MNKDFERCCSFLADMIIKYAPEIKEEVEVCMMIKDSIDDEKVSRQKQFFCFWVLNGYFVDEVVNHHQTEN